MLVASFPNDPEAATNADNHDCDELNYELHNRDSRLRFR